MLTDKSFLICIPAISQNVVDRSVLLLDSASVLEPRPGRLISFLAPMDFPVDHDLAFHENCPQCKLEPIR